MGHFIHEPVDLGYKNLKTTNENGRRYYQAPNGEKYPSVTTVLGVLNRESIREWRARVGTEEANRVSARASSRGTRVHTMVERYLDNRDDYLEKSNHLTRHNFNVMKPVLDERIDKIILQEAPLYSEHLGLAGRVDCVGYFDGRISIIDFKTANKPKKKEWIKGYFMQETAYAIAFEEQTGIPVPNIVTIIVNDIDNEPQVFIERRDRWVRPLFETINLYHKENR